ncbi:transposable element Tcb1 transposase [Trichonephila clavipes]|nr:transposable element Tcb1 transposase [Trichonephila clavipes]
MPLRHFRRQYEQLSQFERGRIIGMMEAGLEWCHARRNWTADEWNQVVFSDESRFNLSSDDNRVRVWRPRGERLNPTFSLQQHTAPIAGVMVWDTIAYNTQSPLVLICGTMTAQRYVHDILQPHVLPLIQRLPGAIFHKTMLGLKRQEYHKTVSALLLPFLGLPDQQICLQLSISGIIRDSELGASHEFGRTRGKGTSNMERNVSRHHTELVSLNARSYRIVHSR